MAKVSKNDLDYDNIIILRSVYDKAPNMRYIIQPCRDPKTGLFPPCVKKVNSMGDMIMSDKERSDYSEGKAMFFPETQEFEIVSGKVFDLSNPVDKAVWDCIKNCKIIAKDRNEKDASGNYIIDGSGPKNNRPGRNGIAELYIDRPGLDTARRVSRKQLIHKAESFIYNDERGLDGLLNMALILGKDMSNQPAADVTDFLIRIAEKDPDKIINLYTGGDINLRLLFISAKKKRVIYLKNKLYLYGDNIVLGATDDAVISWLKDPKNKKVVDLIQKDTFPEYYPETKE